MLNIRQPDGQIRKIMGYQDDYRPYYWTFGRNEAVMSVNVGTCELVYRGL